MNRKLIRPNLNEIKDKMNREQAKKKSHPSSDTFAENYYYLKQMNKRTTMVVALSDGEKVFGIVEWYDRNCIKLNRQDGPNLLIYKSCIKYIHKKEEDRKETAASSGASPRKPGRPRKNP